MSNVEDRLRQAYLAAADLVSDEAVPASPPVPRNFSWHRAVPAGDARSESRRVWRIASLAAAGVTAIALTAGLGVPRLLAQQHQRQRHAPAAARARAQSPQAAAAQPPALPGLPEFVVVSSDTGLQVMQTGTGHVTAQVAAPTGQIFARLAGDGSDRTFYVAAQQADPMATCQSYFYRFSVSAAGRASALTPLPGADQAGLPTALAVTADGSKLAFSITHCADNLPAASSPLSQVTGYVGMLDMASGTVIRNWTFTLSEDYATDLALTPDGSHLLAVQFLPGGSAPMAKELGTDAPSGTIDQASTVVGLPGVNTLSIGADLYGCIATDLPAGGVANQLGVYDLTTGHISAVVHTWTGSEASCWLAPNSVDGNVLVAMDSPQAAVQGGPAPVTDISVLAVNVSTGQLTTLLRTSMSPSDTGVPALVAW